MGKVGKVYSIVKEESFNRVKALLKSGAKVSALVVLADQLGIPKWSYDTFHRIDTADDWANYQESLRMLNERIKARNQQQRGSERANGKNDLPGTPGSEEMVMIDMVKELIEIKKVLLAIHTEAVKRSKSFRLW